LSFEAETEPDVVFFFTVEAAAEACSFILFFFPNSLTQTPSNLMDKCQWCSCQVRTALDVWYVDLPKQAAWPQQLLLLVPIRLLMPEEAKEH
jgi:hypothetical protein